MTVRTVYRRLLFPFWLGLGAGVWSLLDYVGKSQRSIATILAGREPINRPAGKLMASAVFLSRAEWLVSGETEKSRA